MNILNWIAGAGHRRDRRMREERRHHRRRRGDFHDIYHHSEPRWHDHHSDWYSLRHGSHASAEQEPRIIFVSPGPDDVTDRDSDDWHWHHRRYNRRRRHERAYSPSPPYTAHVPENWYRQQYSPPLPDPEPEYEERPRRRYSYLDERDTKSYRRSSPAPSVSYEDTPASPRSTWSFKAPKADPAPIFDVETQRALEESYAQASLGRETSRSRDRSSDRFSSTSTGIPIVDELDDRLRREQHREERRRQRDVIRRESIDQERRHHIAELQAEIEARELQQELRDRGRGLDRDRARFRRSSNGRSSYRSPSVSDVDGLADQFEYLELRRGRHSPLPPPYREREQYVGSLRSDSWTENRPRRRSTSLERSTPDLSEGGAAGDFYLRPRVRFSPAVNYERDFVRRPRVYYRSAEQGSVYVG